MPLPFEGKQSCGDLLPVRKTRVQEECFRLGRMSAADIRNLLADLQIYQVEIYLATIFKNTFTIGV